MRTVTTSISVFEVQAQLYKAAAEKRGMNVSQYFREVVTPFVAQESGLTLPKTPTQGAGGSGTYASADVRALASVLVEQLTKIAAGGK